MRLPVPTLCLCALLGAGSALAQSSSAPGSQAPGSGYGGSGGPTIEQDLDLPISPPGYVRQVELPGMKKPPVDVNLPRPPQDPETPVSSPPMGDDPRDTPPPTFYGEEIPSENDTLVYVIDRSGSMGWGSQSYVDLDGSVKNGPKMDRSKAEIIRSIMGLSQNFRFNIVGYDCYTIMWSTGLQKADDANKQAAIAWVRALQPQGATGTGPATALGLGDKENMAVVLLTDGAPNCGANGFEGHRTMISTNNTQGAVINVFGIAATGSYRGFCQNVAMDSGGSYHDVP